MSFFDFLSGGRKRAVVRRRGSGPRFGTGDGSADDALRDAEDTRMPGDPLSDAGDPAGEKIISDEIRAEEAETQPQPEPGAASETESPAEEQVSVKTDDSAPESAPASSSDDEGAAGADSEPVQEDRAPETATLLHESSASDGPADILSEEPPKEPSKPDLAERIATASGTLISDLVKKAASVISGKDREEKEEAKSQEPASAEAQEGPAPGTAPEAAARVGAAPSERTEGEAASAGSEGGDAPAAGAAAADGAKPDAAPEASPDAGKKKKRVRRVLFDWQLLYLVLALMALGVVSVTSASVATAVSSFNDPLYFGKRDIMYMLIALGAGAAVCTVPVSSVRRYSWMIIVAAIGMIIVTKLFGHSSHGAVRWIKLGPITFQPAEFIKIGWVVFVADVISRKLDAKRKKSMGLKVIGPLLLVFGILGGGLILFQKDFGSMAVLGGVTFAVFLIARLRWIFVISLFVVGALLCTAFILMEPYRVARLLTFLHPFDDPYGKGFQLSQSLIAFGRGGMLGLGLGNSVQKLSYLPEAHTDFIFAIISEETGLAGCLAVIALFGWYILRLVHDSRLAFERRMFFEGYAMFGFACLIFSQVFINIAVASGLFPTKGLTLPFISYGGSSVIMMAIGAAFMIRCDFERRASEYPELACLIPDLHGRTEKEREEARKAAAAQAVAAVQAVESAASRAGESQNDVSAAADAEADDGAGAGDTVPGADDSPESAGAEEQNLEGSGQEGPERSN